MRPGLHACAAAGAIALLAASLGTRASAATLMIDLDNDVYETGGATGRCLSSSACLPLNMISPLGLQVAGVDPTAEPFVYATVTATAGIPGTHSVTWETDRNTGLQLIFFGLTDAPGATYTITGDPLQNPNPPPNQPPVIIPPDPPGDQPPSQPPVIPPTRR